MGSDLNLKATELRLGLPGTEESEQNVIFAGNKRRVFPETTDDYGSKPAASSPRKAQLVGWPPVRFYRKNSIQTKRVECESGSFVKVSLDGAPFLRKTDLGALGHCQQTRLH